MKLHEFQTEFKDLITIVANKMHLPESAIERDYHASVVRLFERGTQARDYASIP